MTKADRIYQNLLKQILEYNTTIETRNHKVYRHFNLPNITFTEFPLITLRKTAWRKSLHEMSWFLSGDSKCPENLKDWWAGQLNSEGELITGYTDQLTGFTFWDDYGNDWDKFNQIEFLTKELKEHPFSRRLVATTWNPGEMANITVANSNPNTPSCCHGTLLQFFVENGALHLKHYQRSVDCLLGLPHNLVQYWAFLTYFAHHAGYKVGSLIWMFGDAHIYNEESHLETATQIIECEEGEAVTANLATFQPEGENYQELILNYNPSSTDFLAKDFSIEGIVPKPKVLIRPKLL